MLTAYIKLIPLQIINLSKGYSLAAIAFILLTASFGCTQKAQTGVQLEIKNVQSDSSSGLYNLSGITNLPESSKIAITAVRYLRSPENQGESQSSDVDINRSILARQIVQVKQGKWESQLNLWQPATDGTLQEAWQKNDGKKTMMPDDEVTFIATYDPNSQSLNLNGEKKEQATAEIPEVEGKLIRFTNEGQRYVQASVTQPINLPSGKTVSPQPQPEDVNGGWGTRYQIPATPSVTTASFAAPTKEKPSTTAPLNPNQLLR
jgi:hypothetical protein